MRIVGGKFRSRTIEFPHDDAITRPTRDMVREGIFNALGSSVFNSVVLDLFAGSGSLGLEALSRSALQAIFVDQDKEAIKTIKTNLSRLNITNAIVIQSDYQKALNEFCLKNMVFDLVFLDPPYKMNISDNIIDYLFEHSLLSKNAIIVIETDFSVKVEDPRFYQIKTYKYGRTLVTIKRRSL